MLILEPQVFGDERGFFMESFNQKAVDIRRGSPSRGRWVGVELSGENHRQVWLPPGMAHGFLVTSESANFLYKTTDYYAPQAERTIRWDDPDIAIDWPLAGTAPALSARDAAAPGLGDVAQARAGAALSETPGRPKSS